MVINYIHSLLTSLFRSQSLFERIFRLIPGIPGKKFTAGAIDVIELAEDESRCFGHGYVGTEQILLGIIKQQEDTKESLFKSLGVSYQRVRSEIRKIVGYGSGSPIKIPFSPRAKQTLELAFEESERLGHKYISTEHLLLGLLNSGESVAIEVLEILGVNRQRLLQQIRNIP